MVGLLVGVTSKWALDLTRSRRPLCTLNSLHVGLNTLEIDETARDRRDGGDDTDGEEGDDGNDPHRRKRHGQDEYAIGRLVRCTASDCSQHTG